MEKTNNIDTFKLKEQYECALRNVCERISDAENESMSTRIGELHSFHIAAFMDIDKTTKSLTKILEYKQQLAKGIIKCSDENMIGQLIAAIKCSDEMIKKILGMYAS